jgi:hypothetical protein
MNKDEANKLTEHARDQYAIAAEALRLRIIEEGDVAFDGHLTDIYNSIRELASKGVFAGRVVITGPQAWGKLAAKLREQGFKVVTGTIGGADSLSYSYDIDWA